MRCKDIGSVAEILSVGTLFGLGPASRQLAASVPAIVNPFPVHRQSIKIINQQPMSTSTKDMSNTFSQSSSTQEEQYLAL
jgi:hypothetical protein